MEKKTLKKILVIAIVFVLTFSNCGFTLQALATSDRLGFFELNLFGHKELEFNAYFVDSNGEEQKSNIADVNDEMALVVELEPKIEGFLKTGTIKAIAEEGETNFEIKEVEVVTLEENTETEEKDEAEEKNETEDLTVVVAPEASLLQSEQIVNTLDNEAQENTAVNNTTVDNTSVDNTTANENIVSEENVEENTVNVENTVSNDAVIENTVEENTVVEDVTEDENTVETPVEEEQLVDEEAVVNEKFEQEKEEEKIEEIKNEAKATVVSGNEIEIENVIQPTKLYIKLQFKPGEKLNPADLYKQINLDLTGKYINVDLKEIEIALDETIEIGWTYSHEFEVSSTYTKVSPFDVVGTRGTIVENRIKVIRNIQDEKYLPIKQTKIEIEVPELHSKKPIEMEVSANKLKATRGEEINEVIFSKENWEYNEETNTLIIIVDNSDAVYTYGEDIYVITYRYEEYVQENEIDLEAKGKVTLEEYSGKENNVLSKDIHSEQKVVVNVGELITYSIGTTEEKINKSKINANYNSAEAAYETEFTSTVNISVLTNDVLKEFKIKDTKEFYVDKQNLEFETQDVKYRKIKFKYEEIAELLQSGGIIEIKCNSGELLYTLNSELIKSQENCELDIKGEITGVEISFQNISVNGNITIDFVKAIGKSSFDKSAFSNFEKIESRIKAEVKYEVSEEATELPEIKTEKYFEDSFTKAEISISKEALSTINSNDDVEIKIELNNHLETSDLYVNPVFEIVFPKYVKNVEAKTTNLLYEDELKLKSTVVYKDGDVIKMQVALEGIQTKFSTGNLTNGTNIIINTNIQLDQYTPKKDDQLRMYYYNEAVTNYESQTKWTVNTGIPTGILKTTNGFDVEVISYQAPSGFVAVNEIENYDGQNSTVASIKQGEETRKVEREKQAQVATMKLVAMNNTGNHATDVLFLGRIPTQEATDVKTGESLGNNIDTAIVTAIVEDVNNPISADIYYSPNAKATKNLNDAANAWTDRPEDISQMKSFMIVPTGTVNAGTVFKYTYNFLIPENLPYEAKMYGSFGAYYNNHSEVAVTYETISADKVGLVTEAGPKVEAVLSVDIGDGTEIGEGRFLHYTLTVVNSGSMTAENITINNPVPGYTTVYEETEIVGSGNYGWFAKSDIGENGLTWTIEKLEPGELQTYNYTLKTMKSPTMEQYYGREVKQDENGYYIEIVENVDTVEPENESNNETQLTRPKEETKKKYVEYFDMFTIKNKASVQVSNLAIDIESNEIKNKLKKSNFNMDIYSKMTNDVYVGENFDLGIDVENITNETLNNVVFEYKLPKELVYKDFTGALSKQQLVIDDLGYTFDEATNIFTITVKQWLPEETLNMIISTQLLRANLNEIEHKIKLTKEDGTSETSHSADTWFKGPILEAIQVCSITDKIVEGENVEFITSITNNGNAEAEETTIAAEISQNLTDVKVELTGAAKTTLVQNEGKVEYVQRFLDVGETVNIKISGKAIEVEDNNSVITNKMFVSNEYVDSVEINEINIQIENDPNKLPTEEEEEDDVQHIINNNSPKDEEDNREEINNNNNNGNNGDDNGDNGNNDNGNNGGSNGNNNNGNDNSNNGNNENVNNNGNSGNNDNGNNNSNNNNGNNNNNNPPKEEIKKYSISGKAWLDADKNGNMDANEEGIAGVQVQLQKDNIMVKATVTGKDGEYTFADLIPGKYIVIYNFDDELYTTTAYKATENRDDINSSAREISKGKAVTNNIFVTNSHIENVNLGLQNKDTFNFSISKYITSATVKTIKGETVHEYKNLELAKLEIAAKEIKGAIVELDYTIVVKNDGNVEGKAIQVVDYLAKDVVFDENDNIGWYLGKDGNAYNDTLKDVVIAPGATKELKISLTKNMTTENTGVLSNKVEVKAENEEGLKEEAKDNSSTQEIIISIKTGYIAQVTISIIVMAGIIGIIYLVVMKKVKIDLKKFRINRIYK